MRNLAKPAATARHSLGMGRAALCGYGNLLNNRALEIAPFLFVCALCFYMLHSKALNITKGVKLGR